MNPKSILKSALFASSLSFLAACGNSSTQVEQVVPEGQSAISLALLQNAPGLPAETDSVWIRISATDLNTQVFGYKTTGIGDTIQIPALANGSNRLIEVKLFNQDSRQVYHAQSYANMEGGIVDINLGLIPDFARLNLEIPIAYNNPENIVFGELKLINSTDTNIVSMTGQGLSRIFNASPVFLGNYSMSLTLRNNLHQALYSIDTLIAIIEASDYKINLLLKALQSKAQLSLATNQTFNTQISVRYPGSLKRTPQTPNEVIFTELLPNPKTSGDNWEWFEVFNTTNDTLLMSNCMIGKTSTSNTASTAWTMDSTITLLPHQMTIFGRENVSFASYHYTGLTLSNTAQSLVLTCNRTKIDSVEYRSPTDSLNPYPFYVAKTIQVKQDSVFSRLKGSSWCNNNQTITSDSLTINASPFSWGSCQ